MSVAIALNNYLHDLATGVFFGCAVAMWAIASTLRTHPERGATLSPIFSALTRALWVSFAWILIGGVPRVAYFPRYEFIPALGKGIVVALAVKHVVLVVAVGFGLLGWWRARILIRNCS